MTRLLALAAFAAAFSVGLAPSTPTLQAADPPKPVATTAADSQGFFFKPNDRIVFLGDSITEQYQYSTYIELYLTTRMPKGNFTFLNAGISGDTANGGAGRFQSFDERITAAPDGQVTEVLSCTE